MYHDKATIDQHESAYIMRQWGWAGYQFGDRIVTLRGNLVGRANQSAASRWWDYDTDNNELILSSLDMTEENLCHYVTKIAAFKPRFINAYPSSLEILARFMRRHGLGGFRVAAVFCESENIYSWQRELIESQLGCRIYAGYGHTERVVDAVECEKHSGYHVNMEYGILELVDGQEWPIVSPATQGRVVGTGLGSPSMPLIRYLTDDLASFAATPCPCGRQSVMLEGIQGRVRELVVTKSGHLIPLMSVLEEYGTIWDQILEFRFVQERPGELVLQVVPASTAVRADIADSLRDEILGPMHGQPFTLQVRSVERIPRTARGKLCWLDQRLPISPADLDGQEEPCEESWKA